MELSQLYIFVVVFLLFLLKTKNQNNQVAKMAVNGNFNDCINSFSDEVQTTVEDILQNSDRDYLMEIPDDSLFNNGTYNSKFIDDIDLDYKLSPDDNATDQVKSQIENHNTNIANKCKEFVVTSTFLNVINSRVQVFVESDMAEEAKFLMQLH